MGNLVDIGGGEGGEEGGEGGEGGEEGGEGGEEGGEGDGEGDDEGGEGGEGGEGRPNVMFRAFSSPSSRSLSGVDSSVEADLRVAATPLFFARTAALWLERDAMSTALALFKASGRALWTLARAANVADGGGGGGEGEIAVVSATPVVGVAGGASLLLSSLRLALLARSRLLLPEWCAWA